jgi:hypothetical protein
MFRQARKVAAWYRDQPHLWTLLRENITRRQIKWFLIVYIGVMLAGSMVVTAANAAEPEPLPCVQTQSCEETRVSGAGDLVPTPEYPTNGGKTLYETYDNAAYWGIDTELTWPGDGWQLALAGLTQVLNFLWVSVVYMTVGLTWWLFGIIDIPGISDAVNAAIGGASGVMLRSLMPTALMAGALSVYLVRQREGRGSQIGGIAWMSVSAIVAISLALAPNLWTSGINNVRTFGSNAVLDIADSAIQSGGANPLAWPEVDYSGNTDRDAMLRKSADAIWNALVVTPWCIAEFGSIDGCTKYGADMLAAGTDAEDRKDVIKKEIYPTEANGDTFNDNEKGKKTETGAWVKGDNPGPRLAITAIALLISLVFCSLILFLGFGTIGAVLLAYLLLIAGVVFAALWCIEGKPRQWGVAWGEALLGATLMSVLGMLTFTTVLVVLTAIFASSASLGWGAAMGLALTLCIVGFSLRKQLAEILGATGPSLGRSMLIGAFVARKLGGGAATGARTAGRAARSASRAARQGAGAVRGARAAARTDGTGPGIRRAFRGGMQGAQHVREGGRARDVRESLRSTRNAANERRQRYETNRPASNSSPRSRGPRRSSANYQLTNERVRPGAGSGSRTTETPQRRQAPARRNPPRPRRGERRGERR